jgi:hypothetical protein
MVDLELTKYLQTFFTAWWLLPYIDTFPLK